MPDPLPEEVTWQKDKAEIQRQLAELTEKLSSNSPPDLTAINQQLTNLSADLASLKQTQPETLKAQQTIATLQSKLEGLETKLTALTASLPPRRTGDVDDPPVPPIKTQHRWV